MTNERGLTMVELMIGLTILLIVLGGAVTAVRYGQLQYEGTVSKSVLDGNTNRSVNRIARLLTQAGVGTIETPPLAPFGGSTLRYQEVAGWNLGVTTWSTECELRLEYEPGELDNDQDDDGDGLIDEGQVVWTRNRGEANEESVVIVRAVREYLEGEEFDGGDTNGNGLEDERGLSFLLDGDELLVSLSLQRVDAGGNVATRTLETSVALRN